MITCSVLTGYNEILAKHASLSSLLVDETKDLANHVKFVQMLTRFFGDENWLTQFSNAKIWQLFFENVAVVRAAILGLILEVHMYLHTETLRAKTEKEKP